eukprot:COSAG04_NODE_1863_length_5363_cov_3.818579_1_plen_57_part_00
MSTRRATRSKGKAPEIIPDPPKAATKKKAAAKKPAKKAPAKKVRLLSVAKMQLAVL